MRYVMYAGIIIATTVLSACATTGSSSNSELPTVRLSHHTHFYDRCTDEYRQICRVECQSGGRSNLQACEDECVQKNEPDCHR
ncbi:MAG: hypothetical protein KIT27_01770 [Legionellales bacterium]|nr:hypothetical protein [Legionellales bacterium]